MILTYLTKVEAPKAISKILSLDNILKSSTTVVKNILTRVKHQDNTKLELYKNKIEQKLDQVIHLLFTNLKFILTVFIYLEAPEI